MWEWGAGTPRWGQGSVSNYAPAGEESGVSELTVMVRTDGVYWSSIVKERNNCKGYIW